MASQTIFPITGSYGISGLAVTLLPSNDLETVTGSYGITGLSATLSVGPIFVVIPSYSTRLDEEPRVLAVSYGDGYEERAGDGINTILQKWSVIFQRRTTAQAISIIQFLRNAKGVNSFRWTPPGEAEGLYVCKRWTRSIIRFDDESVSAIFEETKG